LKVALMAAAMFDRLVDRVGGRLRELLRAAMRPGAFINVRSEARVGEQTVQAE